MNLVLSFLKKRNIPIVYVDHSYTEDGILYSIFSKNKQTESVLTFPLRDIAASSIVSSPDYKVIVALEILFEADDVVEDVNGYKLFYNQLYQIEPDLRDALDLPREQTRLEISVDSKGIAGKDNFSFNTSWYHPDYGYLHRHSQRYGPLVKTSQDELILLHHSQYELLDAIENPVEDGQVEERLRYVAQIKELSRRAEARMDSYVERESYSFIDEYEISPEINEEGYIQLEPQYRPNHPAEAPVIEGMIEQGETYKTTVGSNRNRIFISKNASSAVQEIKNLPKIKGSDIPRFVQNPAAFIPEHIPLDLDRFGDRVKSLGIRVYRAQPFIHANKNNNGWFEFDIGVYSTSLINDSEDTSELDHKFFEYLVSDHIEKLDNFVKHEGVWYEVPNDSEEFIKVKKLIAEESSDEDGVSPIQLPYFIEIFTNLDNVEFNKPLLELRQDFESSGILDPPPSIFNGELYPFQIEGFRWMKLIDYRNTGGLLADDMGLGKTVQVIAFLSHLKNINRITPTLIVSPLTLLDNWKNEISTFCPSIAVGSIYIHQGPNRLTNKESIEQFDIVLTTYDTLVRTQLLLGTIDWECVIIDEAQKIKNYSTSAATVVKALKNNFRLALTGTPVENSLSELWSIMDFVQPGLLGSLKQFKEKYEKPLAKNINSDDFNNVEKELLLQIQPVYKRRTKANELAGKLPRKIIIPSEKVPMGREQIMLYSDVIKLRKAKQIDPLPALNALGQICSHPGIYDTSYENLTIDKVPKLEKTFEILASIKYKDEKVLIFTHFKRMQMILKKHMLEVFNINPSIINGETRYRQQEVDYFNQSKGFNVLILSPQAAGVGLTITGANHVIHYTRWWNPAVENQATDRAYRIGQTKDVKVYYPIVANSMEETLSELLEAKRELAENVIVPSQHLDSRDELMRKIFVND